MKKIFNLFTITLFAVSTACSTKSADANAANETEAIAEETVEGTAKVITLTEPDAVAPGVQVPQLTILDFNAVWCGPCRQLTPVLEQMAEKYHGKATFYSIDVDKFPELFEAYNVGNSIPAVVFIRPDGTSEYYVGTADLLPAEKFEELIQKNL